MMLLCVVFIADINFANSSLAWFCCWALTDLHLRKKKKKKKLEVTKNKKKNVEVTELGNIL